MVTIEESGMVFGPFEEEDVFLVEKCETYKRIGEGVQIAEFIVLRKASEANVVCVVEAKSSSPRTDPKEKFDAFIGQIREKVVNAMNLLLANHLGRHDPTDSGLSGKYKGLDYGEVRFKFILVIRGHQEEWLPPLQDALTQAMNPIVRAWAIPTPAVAVYNDTQARKYRLVVPLEGEKEATA